MPEPAKSNYLPVPAVVVEHHASTVLEALSQWRASQKIPPVNLVVGPQGIGKTSMIYFAAQTLLCERAGFAKPRTAEDDGPGLFGDPGLFGAPGAIAAPPSTPANTGEYPRPCGECPACQKALRGNWVDFTEISANVEDGENASLKIDQFRNLKATMGFGAFDGSYRITLIREADRLTVQAANSLLKVLEEPPKGWVFFLTASDPALLLPTLVSRCQTLRLRPLPTATVLALLEEARVPKDRQAIAAQLSQGSWTQAIRYSEDEVWDTRKTLMLFLDEPAAELNRLVDWAASEPRNFALLLDQLEHILSDLMRWSIEQQSAVIATADSRKKLSAYAERAAKAFGGTPQAREFWYSRGEQIARARHALRAPLNKKLLAQELLMPWLQAV